MGNIIEFNKQKFYEQNDDIPEEGEAQLVNGNIMDSFADIIFNSENYQQESSIISSLSINPRPF